MGFSNSYNTSSTDYSFKLLKKLDDGRNKCVNEINHQKSNIKEYEYYMSYNECSTN